MARLPWLRRRKKTDPELPLEPPLPLGPRSNGEYFTAPGPHEERARALILRLADEKARRLGIERRDFLASSLGMATSLWVVNLVSGCGSSGDDGGSGGSGGSAGSTGGAGGYVVPDAATEDGDLACTLLDTSEWFVFDVQTHHVNPQGSWRQTNPGWQIALNGMPHAFCGLPDLECLGYSQYVEKVFIESDTAVAALTAVPTALCTPARTSGCGNPLENPEIAETRDLVNALAKSQRVVNHCMVTPNIDQALQLDLMEQIHGERGVAAWKCYTQFSIDGTGWWLDDPSSGIPFIEKARSLGVKMVCVHKGLPFSGLGDAAYASAEDIGRVAKLFPDVAFVVYHSAYRALGGTTEGPYDAANAVGVDTLIKSLEDNGIGPNQNVYAELGSTWRELLSYPVDAQHVIGKLLKWVGEDNVLWGTDCIWYGSPQPLIEAFRTFSISEELQQQHGYPALTDAVKKKILGLNAAELYGVDPAAKRCHIEKSDIQQAKLWLDAELGPRRWAFQQPLGPRTRREFFAFLRATEGRPG
jgi:predicted TIM-barrel fold metal-dependent hydrolase